MGCFSWKTSDTNESIWLGSTAYLLQPDGNHIKETYYDGYGRFGGVDAYEWLYLNNPEVFGAGVIDPDERREIAIAWVYRELYRDAAGKQYHFSKKLDGILPGAFIPTSFDAGNRRDDLVQSLGLTPVSRCEYPDISKPLKFSFSQQADYQALPPAEDCPYQGIPAWQNRDLE